MVRGVNLYEKPKFHFTPERNWMNDPNGLLYYKGEYHLFFQHNPNGILWGDMSWGHAVSKDLLNWEYLPVALPFHPDAGIFSGSAVVDYTNSSGFGSVENPAVVAIFTKHLNDGTNQSQCLAYSLDDGRTFTYYDNNPVIDLGMKDFRDPKVWRDHVNNRWLMVVVKPQEFKACFFESEDLQNWNLLSEFGNVGAMGGCWECPDLFRLTTPEGITKWVLIISINPGGPYGGSATQYFIGDWDGTQFTADDTEIRWIDQGTDNYAGVTFNNAPNNRRVFIGWMNNWLYASDYAQANQLLSMTIPRELGLAKTGSTFILTQEPLVEAHQFPAFEITNGISLSIRDDEKELALYFTDKKMRLDRSKGWLLPITEFECDILGATSARIAIDSHTLEIFFNNGQVCSVAHTMNQPHIIYK